MLIIGTMVNYAMMESAANSASKKESVYDTLQKCKREYYPSACDYVCVQGSLFGSGEYYNQCTGEFYYKISGNKVDYKEYKQQTNSETTIFVYALLVCIMGTITIYFLSRCKLFKLGKQKKH